MLQVPIDSASFRSPRRLSLVIVSLHLMFTVGKRVKVGRYEGRHHHRVVLENVSFSLGGI